MWLRIRKGLFLARHSTGTKGKLVIAWLIILQGEVGGCGAHHSTGMKGKLVGVWLIILQGDVGGCVYRSTGMKGSWWAWGSSSL